MARQPEEAGRERAWPLEPVALAAPDPAGLADQAARLESDVLGAPRTPLSRLAARRTRGKPGPWRLALLCADHADLSRELKRARSLLAAGRAPEISRKRVFCAPPEPGGNPPRVAWLFPGLGSQHAGMLADLRPVFPVVNEWLQALDRVLPAGPRGPASRLLYPSSEKSQAQDQSGRNFLASLSGGALAAFAASLALSEVLQGLGCRPRFIAGHSIGENAALVAAGMVSGGREDILRRALKFARVLEGCAITTQAVAVSLADRAELDRALAGRQDRVWWAMDNCPHQAVLIGRAPDVAEVLPRLQAAGAVCLPLDFSQPFHTPLFAERAGHIAGLLADSPMIPGEAPVYSCHSGGPFPSDPEEARDLALAQWTGRVNFRLTLENLFEQGVDCFLEMGPGKMITAFVGDTLRGRPHLALTTGSPDSPCLEQVLAAWCRLFTRGADLDPAVLYGRPPEPDGDQKAGQRTTAAVNGLSRKARAMLLSSHLDLTRQVLASQERLLRALLSRKGPNAMEALVDPVTDSWPLLGEAQAGPDGAMEWRRRLDPDYDLFLADHAFGAEVSRLQPDLRPLAVLPLAMGLEILAQAGSALYQGRLAVRGLSQVRAHRWLAADNGCLDLVIQARPERSPDCGALARVSLSQEGGDAALEGLVHLAQAPAGSADPGVGLAAGDAPRPGPEAAGFYERRLFHGPRFQGIIRLLDCSEDRVEAEVLSLAGPPFIRDAGTERFMLPVTALDCVGQMAAWWLRQARGREDFGIYPFALDSYEQQPVLWRSPRMLRCRLKPRFEHGVLEASLEMRGRDGRLLAGLQGFRLRFFQFSPRMQELFVRPAARTAASAPWHQDQARPVLRRVDAFDWDLLTSGQGIWQRMLAHLYLGPEEREAFYGLPESGPRRAQWLLGRLAAKEAVRLWLEKSCNQNPAPADIRIDSDESGRPLARWAVAGKTEALPEVSLSHCGAVAVAAAGEPGQALGLDYENAAVSKPGIWLREAFGPAEIALASGDEQMGLLAMWCAKEAAAKALGRGLKGGPTAFRVTAWDQEAGLVMVRHQGKELTVWLWLDDPEVLALCTAEKA